MAYCRNHLILLGIITTIALGNGIEVSSKLDFSSSDVSDVESPVVDMKPSVRHNARPASASARGACQTACVYASTVPFKTKKNVIIIPVINESVPTASVCDNEDGPCLKITKPSYNMTDKDIKNQTPVQTVPIYILETDGDAKGPGLVIPNVPVYKGTAESNVNPNENINFVHIGNVNNAQFVRKLIPNYDFRVVPVYKRVKVPQSPRPKCTTTYVYQSRKMHPSLVRHTTMHQRYPHPYSAYGLITRQPIGTQGWTPGSKEQWQGINYQKNRNKQNPSSWHLPWCSASPNKPHGIRPSIVPSTASINVDGKLQFPKDDGITDVKDLGSVDGKLGDFGQ